MKKKEKLGRMLLSFLLTLAMLVGLMPGMGLTAYATTDTVAGGVGYIDENGENKVVSEYTEVTSSTTDWSSGWYVVNGEVTISQSIKLSGDVQLILCDGAELTVTVPGGRNSGIMVNSNQYDSLTIYGQENGTGELNLSNQNGHGIYYQNIDNQVTINGGIITMSSTATGFFCSKVIINSGELNVTSGNGCAFRKNVEINGGKVTAVSSYAQAIGGSVKNTITGKGWTNTEGTEGEAIIPISVEGQSLSDYKKVYFEGKTAATVTQLPKAKELIYNGSAQELVSAGSTDDGTMYYAVTAENTAPIDDNLYTTYIPTATAAGTYYVWYKVVGDKNHLNTEAEPIEVKIDKAKGDTPEEANISLWSSDMACVDAVDGQEYVIVEKGGEPDWTKAVTGDEDGTVIFEGLQPYTEYDIYTRVKETENVYAGEAVSTAFLTDLAGFSVEGDTYVGETLTITTDPEDAEGLSYKWYYVNIVEEDEGYRRTELGDAIEGAEGATYTLTEDDYGKYVCVVIYRGDKEYDRSSEYGPVEYDPEKISYRNTEGAGGEWTKGSSDSLQMTFKRSVVDSETFSHFTGIRVDGKAVDASDYTAEAGSVIIKLNPSFLETLTVGEHVLTVQFDDADDAEADFTVKEAAESAKDADIKADTQADTQKTADEKIDSPKTGDETNPQLMLLVMLLAAIDMALVAFIRSKKREN